tara:strand:- start:141 stop:575 length:435 start_codon:yes stop_codon:yes gene_type:complete
MNNVKKYLKKKYPDATFPAPFAQMLNINFTKLEEGCAQAEILVDKRWTNPFGIAHGGFLFAILDEVLGSSACSVLDKEIYDDVKALSTTNHDIFFHSPAFPGDRLIIKSKVVSSRKNMIFVEGSIENENKILIAESKGIWFIKR